MSSQSGDIDEGTPGDEIRVAEFVLGLLDPAEHEAMARRVAADPILRQEARFWRMRLSGFDTHFEATPPPPATLAAVEQRLFGRETRPARASDWWNSLAVWRGLTGAAATVALVAIGLNVLRPAPIGPEAFATQLVAALEQEGSGVSFIALYDPASGAVRLTGLTGAAVPEKDYELWAIQGSAAPISMGVVPVTGRSQMPLPPQIADTMGEGVVFAITLEPQGGSPTGDPTGPVVAKGAATPI